MNADSSSKSTVGSVVKAARLLELFSMDQPEMTLGELTAGSGYNKTTTHRLLQTLVGVGWLVRAEGGGYRLGGQLLALGGIARAGIDLRAEALPVLRHLAHELGDTAFLMVPGRVGAVMIESVVGSNPLQVHGLTAGSILPYHVAAGPVVLVAYSPELEEAVLAGDRVAYTEHTVCDVEALRTRLAEVRKAGYAVSREDYIVGVGAVAAPVLAADGTPVASLSMGGPVSQFEGERLERAIGLVAQAAEDLGRHL
ncbi:IclR family transcriptional regulator [Janibacter melonis]|uniref:IclR family transcriptional regulator n=1 Tax=Janibacter melonis TaxID=262209 RepID=UPI001786964D|nr:IclR family transcriptional regulator [Janibacter melonis]